MRRLLLALALVGLAVLWVQAQPEKVTLTFNYFADPSMEANVPLVAEFEKRYSHIKVLHRTLPANVDMMHDKYVTSLASGDSSMDVFALDIIWPAEFANARWLLPLDEFVTPAKRATFIPSTLPPVTWKGKLYALPWNCNVGTFFYRLDLLQQAGLPPPGNWNQVVDSSLALRERYPDLLREPLVMQAGRYEGLVCDFLELLWGNDAEVFDANGKVVVNSPRAVESLQYFCDLIWRWKLTPRAVTSYKEDDSYVAFSQGKALYHRSWPYVVKTGLEPTSKIYKKVGFTRIPGKNGPGHGCLGTWNLAISARTRHPREAYLLLDFLTSPYAEKTHALESGLNPSLSALYSDPDLLAQRPYLPEFLTLIETGKPRPVTPLYPKVSRILQIQVHRALTGELTPQQALDEAAWKLEELRRRYPGVPLT